jgi:aryl-alcohol dehydrogenase-like predicted oxidoreductase
LSDPVWQTRRLGAQGPEIPAVGFGCLSFGGAYGPTDRDTSFACLDAAWAAGIRHYDVANIYGNGVSETILGDWLAARGHAAVVATKAGIVTGPTRGADNAAAYLAAELDASLRRLRRERVELFYVHRRDVRVPIEELAGQMARLIAAGKIASWGLSEIAPATLRRAHAVCPVAAVQNEYSLWTRQPDLGLIQACAELGTAFVAFSPLARGMFGETPLDPARFGEGDFRRNNPRFMAPAFAANEARVAAFRAFARRRGWTTAAAALAWVLSRGDHVVAIPGTRHAAHVDAWRQAATIRLTDGDRDTIDRLLPPGWAEGARYSAAQATASENYG